MRCSATSPRARADPRCCNLHDRMTLQEGWLPEVGMSVSGCASGAQFEPKLIAGGPTVTSLTGTGSSNGGVDEFPCEPIGHERRGIRGESG